MYISSSSEEKPELDSPSTCLFSDVKMTYSTTPSPKRSRRAVQKRLVSIPIKDIQGGSRLKGETAPPSDSWAWRKYGQKPIKGSPYPRGYYRCSSSKGCPARKQVERSRLDPSMLLITYSSDHNHPWPASRSHHHPSAASALPDTCQIVPKPEPEQPEPDQPELELEQEQQDEDKQPAIQDRFADLAEQPMVVTAGDEFRWFGDMDTVTSSLLQSPVFAEDVKLGGSGAEAVYFPMREEDESLFADLGELPECSVVFRRGAIEREEERRRCAAAPWCGTTG